MTKLLGSLCVFAACGMVWGKRMRERRRQRRLLAELAAALERMETELRLTRMPLPRLLERLAGRGGEADALFRRTADGLKAGVPFRTAWEQALAALSLPDEERQTLWELSGALQGDEESVCKGISLAAKTLRQRLEEWDVHRPEEDRRATALCFSTAALLVILLI